MNQDPTAIPATRGELLRWLGWFGLVSGCLAALVGTRYLLAFGLPASSLAGVYMLTAFLGQFAALGFLPLVLLVAPIAMIFPNKRLVMYLAVLLSALLLTLIILDTNIFTQYRYHLSRLTVEIFDSSTWIFALTLLFVLLVFQALVATNVWQRVVTSAALRGVPFAACLVFVWMAGQGIHIWADATAYTPVTSFTRYLPAYYPIKAKRRLAQLGWVDPNIVAQQRLLRRAGTGINADSGQLKYPLNALNCSARAEDLPDILFVLVDALRPDKISATRTPRIAEFAAQGQNFTNHSSGGNSSRMGIFSLFYGVPSTYWQTFYDLQMPPLIMQQLEANDFQVVGFSSVGFGSPAQIDRTLFATTAAENLWASDSASDDKNGAISGQWQRWLESERDASRPFFGFLYYDPGNSAAATAQPFAEQSALEAKEQVYLNGISAVDKELDELLEHLDTHQQGRETLIIIASDHGYEFDELGLGYVGHASNYARYQLRSTLLIDWPGKSPQTYTHRSAHQDLPATLLQDLLSCDNPASDYSSGTNLFLRRDWEWFIAGSYNSHAIVEPNKLLVTYPGGMIDLLGNDYRPSPDLELDAGRVEQALLEMRRFYQ
jgi:membrane-anchored protein YejM (alkaline phosphatase superfamily)